MMQTKSYRQSSNSRPIRSCENFDARTIAHADKLASLLNSSDGSRFQFFRHSKNIMVWTKCLFNKGPLQITIIRMLRFLFVEEQRVKFIDAQGRIKEHIFFCHKRYQLFYLG